MSALGATAGDPGPRRPASRGESPAGVLRSEWTKLWTLRSTRWSLLVAFVAMAGLGPLVAAVADVPLVAAAAAGPGDL